MSTPRSRPRVSLAAALSSLALGACASAPRPATPGSLAAAAATVVFENEARDHVHVYLVGERREWLLGRVAPGARARLRLPHAAAEEGPAFVRLAVLAGEAPTVGPARDARAVVTLSQPTAALLGQRWTFAQGQLTPLRLDRARR